MLRVDIEGMPERERFALLAQLETDHPGSAKLAQGKLAGRATPDRPDVPIWEYPAYLESHLQIDPDELAAVRFPVVFYGGTEFTITSAAEYLDADREATVTPPMSLEAVIDLWARLHSAGVVRWDHERRAVEHVRPYEEYTSVVSQWDAALRGSA